jgi:hypothetical protein
MRALPGLDAAVALLERLASRGARPEPEPLQSSQSRQEAKPPPTSW